MGLWRSQGQAAEVFLLDLAAEELNLGPSMNNEATSIPKVGRGGQLSVLQVVAL